MSVEQVDWKGIERLIVYDRVTIPYIEFIEKALYSFDSYSYILPRFQFMQDSSTLYAILEVSLMLNGKSIVSRINIDKNILANLLAYALSTKVTLGEIEGFQWELQRAFIEIAERINREDGDFICLDMHQKQICFSAGEGLVETNSLIHPIIGGFKGVIIHPKNEQVEFVGFKLINKTCGSTKAVYVDQARNLKIVVLTQDFSITDNRVLLVPFENIQISRIDLDRPINLRATESYTNLINKECNIPTGKFYQKIVGARTLKFKQKEMPALDAIRLTYKIQKGAEDNE